MPRTDVTATATRRRRTTTKTTVTATRHSCESDKVAKTNDLGNELAVLPSLRFNVNSETETE